MTDFELAELLSKEAAKDMKIARQHGEMIIAQTKAGNLRVVYYKQNRSYALFAAPSVAYPHGIQIGNLAASGCNLRICELYQVEIAA